MSSSQFFSQTAQWTSRQCGRPLTFGLALAIVLVWGITGPMFNYSDTWQLIINTSRWLPLSPDHRPGESGLWIEQSNERRNAVGADQHALGDRQATSRPSPVFEADAQRRGRCGGRGGRGQLGDQGPPLRDQGHHATAGNPACYGVADHSGTGKARDDL